MKTKSVLFGVVALSQFIGLAGLAQNTVSSSSISPAASAATAPVAAIAGTSTATAPSKPAVNVSYLGIMFGPGLSNELDGKRITGAVPFYENRPSISYNFNNNVDIGLQPRFSVRMGSEVDVVNASWRVYSNIRNVYQDDVLQFNVLARAVLPTSMRNHDQAMLPSPELLPILNISPKNSRFSLSVYPQLIHFLYSDSARSVGATKMVALGNFEGTYQLTGDAAITFGFYPEWVTETNRATYNDSNELDLGVSFNVAKGWSINPFVAAEFVGMGSNDASISKNLAVNMVISGAIL